MDTEETSKLITSALAYAVAGDSHNAATTMQTIGEQSDAARMYGVCCALANVGKLSLQKIYGDQAPRPGSSELWGMEQLKPGALDSDPPKAFAARFLVAYANGDEDTCLALYDAAYKASDEEYVESIAALLADVAGITRLALDQQKGGRS